VLRPHTPHEMTNFKLNFGGIFGGIIAAGGAIAIVLLLSNNGGIPPRTFKLVGLAAFGGAALGNWIWSLALPNEPNNP
jgi:hypothetical protein